MARRIIRPMTSADRSAVAELICHSTNAWYTAHARPPIFPSADAAAVIFDVYLILDPGHGLLAVDPQTQAIVGSCFVHPRPTHLSLGIMNVHPDHCGKGVARELLSHITDIADAARLPTRLVSSALNLDSFSLYTRAGFVPRQAYQDMLITVPAEGVRALVDSGHRLRPAVATDVTHLAALELELLGISRQQDFSYFMNNQPAIWQMTVAENSAGQLDGYMVSCSHPGNPMVGPCAARTQPIASALLGHQLNLHPGKTMVYLVPVDATELVAFSYSLGARNCEVHFSQCRGPWTAPRGILMPTFLPESA